MTAQTNMRVSAPNLNHLRKGDIYLATTHSGATYGKYLGMEALYGERRLMLRGEDGVQSINRHDPVSIELAA